MRSEQVATVNLPSFRAGCGGIDAFAGAFSFINSDQLIAFGRAVAQNAAGFAFELALETISPVIAETMAKLRALAQWVNAQNLNSCETAQALVGAAWSKNDRASASICAAIGTSQGIFSDYAAAKHGCGADGRRNSTLAAASGAMADQVPVNVNYAWKAIRASSFLSGDTQLPEFAMAVTGTLIVTAPVSDADTSGPRVRILEPLAVDRRVTETLMEGGGQLPVYRCDTTADCLNPTLGTATVPPNRGFRARVAELLRDMVDAVRNDTAVPAPALGLVNLTTLPVYRVLGNRHVRIAPALQRPVQRVVVVGQFAAAECGPVAVPETAPERQRQRRDEGPHGRRQPDRGHDLQAAVEQEGRRRGERRGGEAAENDGALPPGRAGGIGTLRCARHDHGLRLPRTPIRGVCRERFGTDSRTPVAGWTFSAPLRFARPPIPSASTGR